MTKQSHTVQLPYLDTLDLTPAVLEAMEAGATSMIDPESPDHILLTFKTPKAAADFAKLVPKDEVAVVKDDGETVVQDDQPKD